MICLLYGDSHNFQQFMWLVAAKKFLHLTEKIIFFPVAEIIHPINLILLRYDGRYCHRHRIENNLCLPHRF